jgi:IclR family KDG regulon transcriptional repressor
LKKSVSIKKTVPQPGRYNIRAIERALTILNLFSKDRSTMSLEEITNETGLSKSTTFRILSTMVYHKYIVIDKESDKYRPGSIFLSLGAAVLASTNIREIASPHLSLLKNTLNVTVLLGAAVDDFLVYIDKKEVDGPIRISSEIGWRRDSLTYGMLGMILLSCRTDEEITAYLHEHTPTAYTVNSLTTVKQCLQRAKEVRKLGYAIEFEETINGVWGVSAPVKNSTGEIIAAVGVTQPMTKKSTALINKTINEVLKCSDTISQELGF